MTIITLKRRSLTKRILRLPITWHSFYVVFRRYHNRVRSSVYAIKLALHTVKP